MVKRAGVPARRGRRGEVVPADAHAALARLDQHAQRVTPLRQVGEPLVIRRMCGSVLVTPALGERRGARDGEARGGEALGLRVAERGVRLDERVEQRHVHTARLQPLLAQTHRLGRAAARERVARRGGRNVSRGVRDLGADVRPLREPAQPAERLVVQRGRALALARARLGLRLRGERARPLLGQLKELKHRAPRGRAERAAHGGVVRRLRAVVREHALVPVHRLHARRAQRRHPRVCRVCEARAALSAGGRSRAARSHVRGRAAVFRFRHQIISAE